MTLATGIALVACVTSIISMVYTMANNNSKKNRTDVLEMAKLSAKIDVLTTITAEIKAKVERIDERERDNEKDIAVIKQAIDEDRV